MRTRPGKIAVALFAVATVSGCADGQPPAGTKTSSLVQPVVLRLVTPDETTFPSKVMIDAFTAALKDQSGGGVDVQVTYQVGAHMPSFDQVSLKALTDGGADLALIPARAWHSQGVTTLEALQLPTLIETDDQADRVARSPAAADLMAGLSTVGATGLGLFPEGLRHIAMFGVQQPLTASSLKGKTVRAPRADTPWATVKALGGTPIDLDEFGDRVLAGTVQAAESSFALYGTLPDSVPPVITGNVSLYYKFQILAARTSAWNKLDPNVQNMVKKAAATSLSATIGGRQKEAAAAQAECAHTVLTAPADLAQIDTVLKATVTSAAADEATASAIAAVRQAAGKAVPAALNPC